MMNKHFVYRNTAEFVRVLRLYMNCEQAHFVIALCVWLSVFLLKSHVKLVNNRHGYSK